MLDQHKRLITIQQAIEIAEENVKERHEINVEADTLEALLLSQQQRKEEFEQEMEDREEDFEQEMNEKMIEWEKKQQEAEQKRKEEEQNAQKLRQREQDEYQYNLRIERQKDEDTYEMKKASLEKELEEKRLEMEKQFIERESGLAASEQELSTLREEVDTFSEKLSAAVEEAKQQATSRTDMKYRYEADLRENEIEGERRLFQQTIASLEAKINDQETRIHHLTDKTSLANNQVQDIALKAIESSAARRDFANLIERKVERERAD